MKYKHLHMANEKCLTGGHLDIPPPLGCARGQPCNRRRSPGGHSGWNMVTHQAVAETWKGKTDPEEQKRVAKQR